MSLSNYAENAALDHLVGTGTFYIALHTADPGETGTNAETTGDSVVRQPDTFTVTGSTADNDSAVQWTTTADKGTQTHYSVWDALTGGNCIGSGALTTSRDWPSGNLDGAAGAFTITLD